MPNPAIAVRSGGPEVSMQNRTRWVPTLSLARHVNDAALVYTLPRMKVLERIPGNPVGIDYRQFGGITALSARNLPSPSFNSIIGLRAGLAHWIQQLIDYSREHGGNGRFDISAGDYDHELGRELVRRGYCPSGCHAALLGEADFVGPPCEHAVEQAQMEDFLDAHVTGWGIPEASRNGFKANIRPWLLEPNWRLYLAKIDGKPAAAAVLFLHEGIAYFADATTASTFRNRGLHSALLTWRWRDAKAAGMEIARSGADYLSTSHRNIERSGMRLLFLRIAWTMSNLPNRRQMAEPS